jgi:hypothetical protein
MTAEYIGEKTSCSPVGVLHVVSVLELALVDEHPLTTAATVTMPRRLHGRARENRITVDALAE